MTKHHIDANLNRYATLEPLGIPPRKKSVHDEYVVELSRKSSAHAAARLEESFGQTKGLENEQKRVRGGLGFELA